MLTLAVATLPPPPTYQMPEAMREGPKKLDRAAGGSCSQLQLLRMERACMKKCHLQKGRSWNRKLGATRQTSKYIFAQALRRLSPSALPEAGQVGIRQGLRLCRAIAAEQRPVYRPQRQVERGGARGSAAPSLEVGVAGVLTRRVS